MQEKTTEQYRAVIQQCFDLFEKKTADYGTAWRVLRPISIIDQIFIKAQRIRTIQEKGTQLVNDDIASEFVGIVNYAIIGNIQLNMPPDIPEELTLEQATNYYTAQAKEAETLMNFKNHDYGEAWRSMSLESLTDLILMKVQRVKQIIGNKGKTSVSEGIEANYYDMINYAVFALILMSEKKE